MATKKNTGTPADYGRWDTPPVIPVKVTHIPPAAQRAIAKYSGQNAKKGGAKAKK